MEMECVEGVAVEEEDAKMTCFGRWAASWAACCSSWRRGQDQEVMLTVTVTSVHHRRRRLVSPRFP